MKSKPNMSKHSWVKKEWSVLFKKAIRESKKKKRLIKEKRKEEENKKNLRKKKQFNIGRDCATRETILMKIFASSTGPPSTHRQEHGRHWISHVCGEQKKWWCSGIRATNVGTFNCGEIVNAHQECEPKTM